MTTPRRSRSGTGRARRGTTAPQADNGAAPLTLLVTLAIALAVPRIVRLLYPQVWIEDESYLNGAFLLSRGVAPYRGFPLPHLPVFEGLLAAVLLVAPAAIRTAETVTALMAYAGSWLVFGIGRRIAGPLAGACAALLFATSGLLFRYHLFEREVFLIVPVMAAVLLVMRARTATASDADTGSTARVAGAGVLLALAMAIKLTAFASLAGVVAWLVIDGRRRAAARVAAVALGLIAAASLLLSAAFGRAFLIQVFVFRAAHASFPSLLVKIDEMRYTTDISLALGLAAIVFLAWTRAVRTFAAPLALVAAGVLFLVILNPTYWAHTGIELLPWLALIGGGLVAALLADARARGAAIACAAGALALLLTIVPFDNLNWRVGDTDTPYGFGYRDRAEIAAAAAYVAAHAPGDARVATPPLIAFAANRRELVPYAEVAGEMDELDELVRTRGWRAALTDGRLRSRTFWDSVEASRDRMAPAVAAALRARDVAVVINDSPADLMPVPLIDLSQDTLESSGYQLGTVTPNYELWVPRR